MEESERERARLLESERLFRSETAATLKSFHTEARTDGSVYLFHQTKQKKKPAVELEPGASGCSRSLAPGASDRRAPALDAASRSAQLVCSESPF